MSIWSKIKKKVNKTYTSIDKKVGGALPGGYEKPSSSSSSSSGSSSSGTATIWSKIKKKVNKTYTSIDKKVGGALPGGYEKPSSSSSSSSGSSSSGTATIGGKGYTPSSSSGSSSSGTATIGGKGYTPPTVGQPITDTQISQALNVANQRNIQSQITNINKYEKSTQVLQNAGIVPLPTSSSSNPNNPFSLENRKRNLENQQMSVIEPDLTNVDVQDLTERGTKSMWGGKSNDYVKPAVVEEILNQRSTQVILRARNQKVGEQINKQVDIEKQNIDNYVSLANTTLNDYTNKLQNDINSGKISVSQAEKSLESLQTRLNENIVSYSNKRNEELKTIGTALDKKWWDERGQYLDKSAGKIISSYRTLNILEKANVPNIAIATAGGFAVGVGAGAGLGILGTTAGASTASSVGKGLAIGFGLLAVRSGGKAVYSLSKQYSAGEISKGEFVANIAVGGIFTGASIGGAMAGGLAVKAITNYSRLTPEEKAIAKKLLNRKNSIEVENIKGSLTESQIKELKISSTQKANLLKEIRVGNSVQRAKIKINKFGLTPAEIKVANKLNFRGTGYQVTSSVGKSVTGASSYNIKTGRGIARFNSQMTREVTSLFSGKSNKGSITGLSVSEIRTPQRRSLLRFGDKPTLNEARLEMVKGTGKVKYSKEGGNIIRYEYSKGTSKLLRADVYDSKGNWIKSNINAPTGVSESIRVSKLYGQEGVLQGDLSTGRINTKTTTIFKDIAGRGLSGKETSFFNYENVPTKTIKGYSGTATDEGLLTIKKIAPPKVTPKIPTPQETIVSAGKSTLMNIETVKPSYVGGEGGFLSYSSYSGNGVGFAENNVQFLQAPITKPDFSITGMSILNSPTPEVETPIQQKYQEPVFNQLFINPKITSKESFQAPIFNQLIVQPQAGVKVLQPQAKQLFAQPKVITKQITKLQTPQVTSLNVLSPQIAQTVTTPMVIPGAIGLFGLPNLGTIKTGGGQKGTRQKTKSSFLPEYNPSLGSVLTRQKTKEVTQKEFNLLSKKKYSGLRSRSLIKIIPKKKKVKKKK